MPFFTSPSALHSSSFFFFFNDTATTEIYTLSLHDALPISYQRRGLKTGSARLPSLPRRGLKTGSARLPSLPKRSEEHTSELQSPCNLVCRLLLEKKKKKNLKWRPLALIRRKLYILDQLSIA